MNKTTQQLLIGAAIASLVGLGGTATNAMAKSKKKAGVKCEGGNSCKGKSACKSDKNACKGQNGCAAQGFVMAKSQKSCDGMKKKAEATAAKAAPTAPSGEAGAPAGGEAPKAQ